MTFDPDAFLAETENTQKGTFDPDSFLEETKGMDPPEPKPIPEPNLEPLKKLKPPKEGAKEASTFLEFIEAGYDISTLGLAINRDKPDVVLPENAPMFYRLASQLTTVVADIPAMVLGGVAGLKVGAAGGAALGTAVAPGPGTAVGGAVGGLVGAAAGSNALPEVIRHTLLQAYDEGSVDSFADFWEKAAPVMIETAKAGFLGAATFGVGAKAGKVVAPLASKGFAGLAASKAAVATSEVATMTTLGAALNGQVPEPQDFADAAVLIGGLHGAGLVAKKIGDTYVKSGVTPDQIIREAEVRPSIVEDLNSKNIDLPRGFDPVVKEVSVGGELGRPSPVIGDEASTVVRLKEKPKVTPEETPPAEPPKTGGGDGGGEIPPTPDRINIVEHPEIQGKTFKERVREFVQSWVDDLDPTKRFERAMNNGELLPGDQSAYKHLINFRGAGDGVADLFITKGTLDFKTKNVNGKSLNQILEPVNSDIDGFTQYVAALRAKGLHAKGKKTGIDPALAEDIVNKGKAKYDTHAQELQGYNERVLRYMRDSEVISNDLYNKIKDDFHVPFYRALEDDVGGPKGSKTNPIRNPVKRFKGSEAPILDPIESIAKNTQLFIRMAEKNRAVKKLTDIADANPDNGWIEPAKTKMKPTKITDKELSRFLKEQGIDADITEAFTIFRPREISGLRKGQIAVLKDGKLKVYDSSELMAKAFDAIDRPGVANFAVKLLRPFATALRIGTTFAPEFQLRNIFRDQGMAAIQSKSGYRPFVDYLEGISTIISKDGRFINWAAHGGMNSHMLFMDKQYIQSNVWKLGKETGFIAKTRNLIKSPFEMMQVVTEITENATRVGEFNRALKTGVDPVEAAYRSRNVTIDFAKMGAKMQAVNMIAAFLNANVQGHVRFGEALREDPVGTNTRAVIAVTLPSIALWWAQRDDSRIKDINRAQKDLHWLVATDDWVEDTQNIASELEPDLVRREGGKTFVNMGTVYRIPKPFEAGIIYGSLMERILDSYYKDDPKAFDHFQETLISAFAPDGVPNFIRAVQEHRENRSSFTGFPIIPRTKEDLLPELQYTDYTSETAKLLSKVAGFMPPLKETDAESPAIIDHYIRAWTGTLGKYALDLADLALEKAGVVDPKQKASKPFESLPFVRAFTVRYPQWSQAVEDFYDASNRIEKIAASRRTIQREKGPEAAREFTRKHAAEIFARSNLKSARKAITNMQHFISSIEANPALTRDEKREKIDAVLYRRKRVAQRALQFYEDLKKRIEDDQLLSIPITEEDDE